MLTGTAGALLLAGLVVPAPGARGVAFSLPLGDSTLTEVRTSRAVAEGVHHISIVRGSTPAAASRIGTTAKGPWRINVLSIDPKTAAGRIEATYGTDLARTASTSYLVQFARAAAGVNASFFTFGKNPLYPGDPVGLGLYGGKLLSEPEATSTEVDFVINAKTKKALIGRLTWAGSMRHRDTGTRLALEHLNHPNLRQCVQCEIERDHVQGRIRRGELFVQRHTLCAAPAFLESPMPGMVDEDAPHQPRRNAKKVRAVLPADAPGVGQPQECLIDQCRGLQRVLAAFPAPCNAPASRRSSASTSGIGRSRASSSPSLHARSSSVTPSLISHSPSGPGVRAFPGEDGSVPPRREKRNEE